jgi:RNA polymerase sigma factor (sigma-70 family)
MRKTDGEDERTWEPPDTAPSPRQRAEGRQGVEALAQALGEMSPDHREILMLRFADGLDYEEIATTLEVSIGTVKSRISRARRQLRGKMDPFLD